MNKTNKTLFYIFLSLTVILDIFIITESCLGGVSSASQSQGFTQFVIDVVKAFDPSSTIDQNPESVHQVVRKVVGHFLLFGVSGALNILTLMFINEPFGKNKLKVILIGLGCGVFLSVLTELIQYFVPGRAGMITDVLIDFGGFLFFGFLVYIIFLINNNKKQKLKEA